MRHIKHSAWLLVAMSAAAYPSPDERGQFVQIDQQFGSYRLGATPAQPLGRLVEDGELACGEYPYSSCGYDQDGYVYYYWDGSLASKTFLFGPQTLDGPLGLKVGDDASDVISKIGAYVKGRAPVRADNTLFYALDCQPRLCRLDIELGENGIAHIRLYYSDLT